jgi:hypothetical protein
VNPLLVRSLSVQCEQTRKLGLGERLAEEVYESRNSECLEFLQDG